MAGRHTKERDVDVVLLGATGFTGGLTAEYLATHAPASLRWALAGRNLRKLEDVRERLVHLNPALVDLPLLTADVTDPASLADLAARTRVLATTVGPYLTHGEPVVAACAEAGTDYLDLTGEPEFVDRMYLAHHATAQRTGARLVHACGFDSVPHDLGVLFTVQQFAATAPSGPADAVAGPLDVRGVVRAKGTFSGGTFHSALTAMSRPHQMKQAAADRRRAEPRPAGRSSRAVAGKPHRDPLLDLWLLPLPTLDPFIVARSGAALEAYGPSFRYSHYAGTRTLRYAAGGAAGVASLALAARARPVREWLLGRVAQGDGPDAGQRASSWFRVDFVTEGGGRTLHTRVTGGDPGYGATAAMLAEAALCLALDDNPPTSGQVTTAQAMGEHLIARLQATGINFTVVE